MTGARRGSGFALALLGGALLAAATPPAVFPGAEFLVLVGLAAWFALARDTRRSWWCSYLLGCVHMAWFSWSIHHVMWPAYVAIVVLGGGYFVLGTAALRAVPRRGQALAFGVVVAGSFWLRASVPAIHYPHGQPCHCLWQWPVLLGSVTVGGEGLANALLGWLAASLGELWQGWRIGAPSWRAARRRGALALAAAFVATGAGCAVAFLSGSATAPSSDGPPPASLVLVEPGLHSFDYLRGLPETFEERLRRPTQSLLLEGLGDVPRVPRPGDPPRPDRTLVLWPESSIPVTIPVDEIANGTARLLADKLTPLATAPRRLLLGINVERAGRETPAAVLVDLETGKVLGHQEKRCLVPGGEFIPLLHLLPQSVVDWARGVFEEALGSMPDLEPGRELPLLHTIDGTPFGTLLCYDNAFPGPAADQVAAGARFLCVLSNESWYRGGGELTQLMAMTVCRALETGTPIVRCTTDGWSGVVGADGRLREQLPILPSPTTAARNLVVHLEPGPGRLPPLAWLRAATGPLAALLLGLALLHGVWRWARLRVARTAPAAAGGPGRPGSAPASGS
ncbi:MAG: apolipoprotein N-acyltransferase [Planctomycetes bacterium]|nr:apolipoprotein N-acyltransferase [Planctomycetota bacterium]